MSSRKTTNGKFQENKTKMHSKRKPNRQRDGKFKSAPKNDVAADKEYSPTNAVEWYEQTPELLRDAASLPFSYATGTRYNMGYGGFKAGYTTYNSSADEVVPGIMAMTVLPIIGDTTDPAHPVATSPVNIAAMAQYSFVRHANSGSRNYTAPNLMMYCMAVAQIYSYLNYLQRVYGTCQLYAHTNRYYPRAVIQAQGVSFDDLTSHLADYRYGVNAIIRKISAFACPSNMTYFRRLAFLFSGIYSEGESIKDQLYMYVPEGFMQLVEADSTPGWRLGFNGFFGNGSITEDGISGLYSVQDLLNYGNQLIQPLLMSEDINVMSGDILKAYGQEGILSLATLPEVFEIMPVTDLTVLEQFQNADFIGQTGWLFDFNPNWWVGVKEDPDTNLIASYIARNSKIGSNDWVSGQLMSNRSDHMLNTILVSPNPGDVIERTRFMTTYETYTDSTDQYVGIISGSEICVRLYIVKGSPTTTTAQIIQVNPVEAVNYTGTVPELQSSVQNNIIEHCRLENFKFHPKKQYWLSNKVSDTEYTANYIGTALDIDNYTIVSEGVVKRMNEAALLSLFRVPSIAKVN